MAGKKRRKASPASATGTFPFQSVVLSASQKTCQNTIKENILTFVEGCAGVGKTLCILHEFCKTYVQDNTKKIVVIRTPAESAGKDKIGYLPSDYAAKIEPHFSSTKMILNQLLGEGKVEADTRLGRIQFHVPNFILGATLNDSLVFIDEGQMTEPLTMKLLLERIGKDSTCVVAGDLSQVYATDTQRNGMQNAMSKFWTPEGTVYENVGKFTFSVDDVLRSDIVKTVIKAYRATPDGPLATPQRKPPRIIPLSTKE